MLLNLLLIGKDLMSPKETDNSGYFVIFKPDSENLWPPVNVKWLKLIILRIRMKVSRKASIVNSKHICAIHNHSFEAYQGFEILPVFIYLIVLFYYLKPEVLLY